MTALPFKIVSSPIGEFIAAASSTGLCLFEFLDRGGLERVQARIEKRYGKQLTPGSSSIIDLAIGQVGEYFDGTRKRFSIPLDLRGSRFEMAVWHELLNIPYGETRSYGEIANIVENPGAARAVGRANGANFIPIIIPCHRVIQENGQLRGYGGGLWRKEFLLNLERSVVGKSVRAEAEAAL